MGVAELAVNYRGEVNYNTQQHSNNGIIGKAKQNKKKSWPDFPQDVTHMAKT